MYASQRVVQGLYDRADLVRFVCSCISLSGPFSLLRVLK
jgi:hypothetical protein